MTLGEQIRQERQRQGLTQEQLARKADVRLNQVVRVELGEVDPRFNQTVLPILRALAMDPDNELSLDVVVAMPPKAARLVKGADKPEDSPLCQPALALPAA